MISLDLIFLFSTCLLYVTNGGGCLRCFQLLEKEDWTMAKKGIIFIALTDDEVATNCGAVHIYQISGDPCQ